MFVRSFSIVHKPKRKIKNGQIKSKRSHRYDGWDESQWLIIFSGGVRLSGRSRAVWYGWQRAAPPFDAVNSWAGTGRRRERRSAPTRADDAADAASSIFGYGDQVFQSLTVFLVLFKLFTGSQNISWHQKKNISINYFETCYVLKLLYHNLI